MFSSNTSQVAATASQAEAIDFDGTNDYLYRTSDLTGNADGKTFTFSAWVWMDPTSSDNAIYSLGTTGGGYIRFTASTGVLSINLQNTAGSALVLNVTGTAAACPFYTWTNLLISVDLASTANRRVYVNDQLVTVTWTTYTNAAINWTQTAHYVASQYGSAKSKARLSNVFLDYTYRDLTVEANRRLFVTADLKPAAGQAALNPILYLPMSDPTAPGLNQGTGGNFTLTGTVARSGRGPNQYNAPYSDLDGSTDYLSKATNLTGIANSKLITLQFCMNLDTVSSGYLLYFDDNGGASSPFRVYLETNGEITIDGFANTVTQCLKVRTVGTSFVAGRNYVITVSVDMSSTSRRFFYVNGSAISPTWTTYLNLAIVLNYASPSLGIGADGAGSTKTNGRLGALWFNTGYIDLSVASNLAKFVSGTGIDAKPVDLGANGELPTGTSPLIYLPMYGDNAGKNYGTGGNFTVNSGPYTGARGPNEFWGNKADFNGTNGRLSRTSALSTLADSKTFSASFFVQPDVFGGQPDIFSMMSSGNTYYFKIQVNGAGGIELLAQNIAASRILYFTTTTTAITTAGAYVQICIDLANTAKRFVYINGVSQSVTYTNYTNSTIAFSSAARPTFAAVWDGSTYQNWFNGKISEFYLTSDYIDFSQEANRLKFRDAFGNPVNLTQQIEDAAIPTPQIYMRFPPTAFGTNSGTGGDFTVSGTITDGGQL